MDNKFTWIPFYKELSDWLLEKQGCLSKNVNLTNRVDPDVLNDWMISQRLFD